MVKSKFKKEFKKVFGTPKGKGFELEPLKPKSKKDRKTSPLPKGFRARKGTGSEFFGKDFFN